MKINPMTVTNLYKYSQINGTPAMTKPLTEQPNGLAKMDSVSISAQGSQQKMVSQLVQDIAQEVSQPIAAQRLNQIKEAVDNNTYRIASHTLADAILARFGQR